MSERPTRLTYEQARADFLTYCMVKLGRTDLAERAKEFAEQRQHLGRRAVEPAKIEETQDA